MRLFSTVWCRFWLFVFGLWACFFMPCTLVAGETVKESSGLNLENLKESIARRTRFSWGERDERFKTFSRENVRIVQQVPVEVNGSVLFAVKVKLRMPAPDTHEEQLLLVVDGGGQLQFTDIQDLSTGRSLMEDSMAVLRKIDNLPKDFGTVLFRGKGKHEMVVVSDPFCPYCRKGWVFLKGQREKIKTLRLAHFPLNRISEVTCMVLTDVETRDFRVLEVVDFAYENLTFTQDPQVLLQQFLAAFPELKKKWGEDGAAALAYLESHYQEKIRKERMDAQTLGISSTPVFFVNGHMVEGFQAEKLGERLQ